MSRTVARRSAAALAALSALAAGLVATGSAAHAEFWDPTMDLPRATSPYVGTGPARPYVQQIPIGGVVPLKNQAMINRTDHGLLFRGGQQNNDLTITQAGDKLRFVDTATLSWKYLDPACSPVSVPKGIGAVCSIAPKFTPDALPMLIEVWPRLGNDSVDSRTLPALYDLSFLGDRGDDTAFTGDGDDFVNGAQENDRASGGAGRDWIRGNIGDDWIDGGADADHLVGVDGNDIVYGGSGNDFVAGSGGHDQLFAGEGTDKLACAAGQDRAEAKSTDKLVGCETVVRMGS